jgi:hypothetical protein
LDPSNRDEFETALESLGQIGLCKYVVLWLQAVRRDWILSSFLSFPLLTIYLS